MIKIGRYGVAFGRTFWVQTKAPTQIKHFLWIWLFREARPTDIDEHPRFPLDTPMDYEGRHYRYWKQG